MDFTAYPKPYVAAMHFEAAAGTGEINQIAARGGREQCTSAAA